MKLWLDDVREAPRGYVWLKSVNKAIYFMEHLHKTTSDKCISFWKALLSSNTEQCQSIQKEIHDMNQALLIVDIDHDAGEFSIDGGDYIKFLDYLEEQEYKFVVVHIHSMNPVGVENMRRIIKRNEKNGWKEI